MRRSARILTVAWLALAVALPAWADEPVVVVSGARVHLGDLAPDLAPGLLTVDLGPAPPPGKSRLFSRQEVSDKLQAAGIAASKLNLPASGVRVETEGRRFSPEELSTLVEPAVRAALPSGVRLIAIKALQGHVLAPSVRPGQVRLPRFALRDGEQKQTGTVEILWGKDALMRLPVQLHVSVSGSDAGALVPRGSSVTLVIARGPVEISTQGETLSAGRVGDSVSVRVGVTKKVLSARLTHAGRAEVEL